ncbi:MAG: hypothetical protein L0H73_05295 [Nitrococcus sp.]|nr:hypothetical protein [Nitrococcus sp.]
MSKRNPYCAVLGIDVPRLEVVKDHREANYYSLLIVALLERGEPITLEEAARRFEDADIADQERSLASLKRCKPDRPPVYRDGDLYALDPHDDWADLWVFRLDLRPPKAVPFPVVRPELGALPSPDKPLTIAHLDEAWREGIPNAWSAQRIAICVLDAHRRAMKSHEVLGFVRSRKLPGMLSEGSDSYWRRSTPIRVHEGGFWELGVDHDAVRSARQAVRARIEQTRRWAHMQPNPALMEANRKRIERRRQAHGEALARMRRVLLYPFPTKNPEALVLLDVQRRELATFLGEETAEATRRLAEYDIIVGVDVRGLLGTLGIEPGERRLADLRPPQKTRRLNKRGRTLKITTKLLVQGSCGITRPFGDEQVLQRYLRERQYSKLRQRLEADAKSLFALYQYGRLHGAVRLRWGFLDETIPVPWAHPDEPRLHNLKQQAVAQGIPLEIVVGSAPGWADRWSRGQLGSVAKEPGGWYLWIVDEGGYVIDEHEIQLARLANATATSS